MTSMRELRRKYRVMTLTEVAGYMGVSADSLRASRRRGTFDLPPVEESVFLVSVWDEDAVAAWVESHRI